MDANNIARWLEQLPVGANSGDIYASIDPVPLRKASA
jgi:hypothetical protein